MVLAKRRIKLADDIAVDAPPFGLPVVVLFATGAAVEFTGIVALGCTVLLPDAATASENNICSRPTANIPIMIIFRAIVLKEINLIATLSRAQLLANEKSVGALKTYSHTALHRNALANVCASH